MEASTCIGAPIVEPLFMVQVVLALLAVVIGSQSIVEEREKGALAVLLAGPVPRHHEFSQELVRIENAMQQQLNDIGRDLARIHGPENVAAALVQESSRAGRLIRESGERSNVALERYLNMKISRGKVAQLLAGVMPSGCFASMAQRLSHTGPAASAEYRRQAHSYRRRMLELQFELVAEDVRNGRDPSQVRDMRNDIPTFSFRPLSAAHRLHSTIPSVIVLAGWFVLSFLVAYRRFCVDMAI
ncbi:MAG: hypothetical protein GF331_10360 [Chitinivibrionales bacterium]|nr:hypothetical protein [Chitinivibrionales bacterium]